jgi:futalosine hydrolase
MMHILVVAATPFEIAPLQNYLEKQFEQESDHIFHSGNLQVQLLVTGVGMVATTYALSRVLHRQSFNLVINAGVAGSLNPDWPLGQVVQVISERYGDLGVEEQDGSFTDAFELELIGKDDPPYREGRLWNDQAAAFDFLPKAHGITVNKVHGAEESIERIARKRKEEIETMEGAAFFYTCLQERVPFLQIRALSNYVEPRNRHHWELDKAISALNQTLVQMLGLLARPSA